MASCDNITNYGERKFVSMKTGILLVNLGSPTEPTPKATRKYLAQFLKDRHVIKLHPVLWWPILYGIILRTRPVKSANAYAKIWRKDEYGEFVEYSNLIETTIAQANAVQSALGGSVVVKVSMRYGLPSIQEGLEGLQSSGCNKILVVPLYPQFAEATTESVYDEISRVQKKMRNLPPIKHTPSYPDHPLYIATITNSLTEFLASLDWEVDKILVSFHGLPKSSIDNGDPYEKECEQTFALIMQALPTLQSKLKLTYQSRFGPKEWLGPYTTEALKACVEAGQRNIVILTPGFSADCLETLEELAIRAKQDFRAAGGENLRLVPCLNVRKKHIEFLTRFIQEQLETLW